MIELVYILREFAQIAYEGGKSVSIKFGELEQLVFDRLWREKRIAIYITPWEMEKELERLADLGLIRYVSSEVKIENPSEFLKKTEPFILATRNMISSNEYLEYAIQTIQNGAKEYARGVLAPRA